MRDDLAGSVASRGRTERRRRVEPAFLVLGVVALVMIGIAFYTKGWPGFTGGLAAAGRLLRSIGPQMLLGILMAGFIQVVLPTRLVSSWLGEGAGLRGIFIATGAGVIAPGGPFIQYPLALSLYKSGAGLGPVVAYLTAWEAIPLMRAFVWEIPMLGVPFAAARYIVSLALPIFMGLAVPWVMQVLFRTTTLGR
jgi:uncharacterized membrane protein YraQ (UPF0718 family)